jgi:hypothetical protein
MPGRLSSPVIRILPAWTALFLSSEQLGDESPELPAPSCLQHLGRRAEPRSTLHDDSDA